ncbi:MarR family winged helix-turn-helix transcriptional regulator [Deinococcus koreensis]|uniref:MarR family transcriptional regulator n=1 Tax=Deinococcus koreensis TaxID=2054903 RepID=A0A2K3UTG4_9DEIO|nr:MarR family transcriptional regulator [Deinococcus koreensis]PNY79834.1 MarR family transcriptional regulator [Deinococcus koreensis]
MTRSTDIPAAGSTLEHDVYLALQRLSLRLRDETEEVFKAQGLSSTQFNVLRILRGAGDQGLTCGEIGARLINKDPDVTRLLDRMEKHGLVERARSEQDRRVVLTRLSGRGRDLVGHFDGPLSELHGRQFAHLEPEQLQALLALLQGAPTA